MNNPVDKKMITPYIEWLIGKNPGLCTILAYGTLSLCFITQLFRVFRIL